MLHGAYSDSGGAEIVVTQQAQKLSERGHEILLFCYGEQNIKRKDLIVIKESSFLFFRHLSKLLIHPGGYRTIKKAIKSFRPDIIHLNNIDKYPLTFLLPMKYQKTLRSVHDYGIVCPLGRGVRRDDLKICDQKIGLKCVRHGCISVFFFPLRYYLFEISKHFQQKRIKAYLAATDTLKNFMLAQGFKGISVSPYFSALQGKPSFDYEEKKVLFVGALEEHKGCDLLINAFNIAVKNIPDSRLIILGEGKQKQKLKNLCRSLNLEDKIHFAGIVSRTDMNSYYSDAAIVVVPSLSMENSPLVIYEAFSFGKPVIATKRGGNTDLVIDGYNGFLVDTDNQHEMAQAIMNIFNKNKTTHYLSMAKNAFASSNLYSLDKYIDKLEELYAVL